MPNIASVSRSERPSALSEPSLCNTVSRIATPPSKAIRPGSDSSRSRTTLRCPFASAAVSAITRLPFAFLFASMKLPVAVSAAPAQFSDACRLEMISTRSRPCTRNRMVPSTMRSSGTSSSDGIAGLNGRPPISLPSGDSSIERRGRSSVSVAILISPNRSGQNWRLAWSAPTAGPFFEPSSR